MKIKKLLKAILYTAIILGLIYLLITHGPGFGKRHPTIGYILNLIALLAAISALVWAVYLANDD